MSRLASLGTTTATETGAEPRQDRVEETPRSTASRKGDADALSALLLLLLSFAAYLNSLGDGFVYDDQFQVVANPYAHSFHYLGKIFGGTVWTFQGAGGISNYYRPLMTLAYLACYKLFGPIPFGFHLLNVALNAGVVLLLYAVTRKLFGDRFLALAAAGLFALHPVHTESVSWIAGVTDLELSFFFLLTFLLYLGVPESEASGKGLRRQVVLLSCYALALLSKEQALVLPVVAAAYEHFYRADRGATTPETKLRRYLPLWAVAAAYVAFRHFVLGSFAPSPYRPEMHWSTVLLTAVGLVGGYLGKLIWPAHLLAYYVFHEASRPSDPRFLAGVAALAACLGLFLWLWRKDRLASFGLVWMGVTLAPVLDARLLPAQVFAERYLYLPSAGFCWLAAWAAAKAWKDTAARSRQGGGAIWSALGAAVPAVLVIVAAVYGARTVTRNRDWRSEEALYRATLAAQPDAQIIRTNLGVLYWDRRQTAAAEREWTAALSGPHAPFAATLNDMGMARLEQQRYDEAIGFFERALGVNGLFMDPHKNLGTVYAKQGKLAEADREYRRAVELAPLSTDAHNTYGRFLLDQGRTAEAAEQFKESAQTDDNNEAEKSLGGILLAQGDLAGAERSFRAALRLYPYDSEAHFGLAKVAERQGRAAEALVEYRAGLATEPANAEALAAVRRLTEAGPTAAPR